MESQLSVNTADSTEISELTEVCWAHDVQAYVSVPSYRDTNHLLTKWPVGDLSFITVSAFAFLATGKFVKDNNNQILLYYKITCTLTAVVCHLEMNKTVLQGYNWQIKYKLKSRNSVWQTNPPGFCP